MYSDWGKLNCLSLSAITNQLIVSVFPNNTDAILVRIYNFGLQPCKGQKEETVRIGN